MREPVRIFNGDNNPSVFPTDRDGESLPAVTRCMMDLLDEAEEWFGKRDMEFTLLGVEFSYYERPQLLWWPNRYAIIQLEYSAFLDLEEACSQCAHELVHLLSPIEKKDATFLEEGVATYFERHVREKVNRINPFPEEKYQQAYQDVKLLFDIDKQAIKKLRDVEFTISKITEQQILAIFPTLDEKVAKSLVRKFYPDEAATR